MSRVFFLNLYAANAWLIKFSVHNTVLPEVKNSNFKIIIVIIDDDVDFLRNNFFSPYTCNIRVLFFN